MEHFLTIADVPAATLANLVRLAEALKRDPQRFSGRLDGAAVGLFFMKPSTRTRVSSEVAAVQLGAHPVVLKDEEVGLGGREPPEDVARVLSRYLRALALRVFDHTDLERMAEVAEIPVINLLSDLEHPCQALADVVTIAGVRPVEGATVAYVGDGNNVCHSLAAAVTKLGGHMRVATPLGHEPAETYRFSVELFNDPVAAVEGADVVYTDVWTSMGQEAEADDRRETFAGFTVDPAMMARAAPGAIFLHCLPAHRGEEVADEVFEGPASHVFDQAENRLHAFKAVLLELLA